MKKKLNYFGLPGYGSANEIAIRRGGVAAFILTGKEETV